MWVGEGAVEQADDLVGREGDEGEDAAAAEEGGVDFEGGVLGGGADEADGAAFDVGQEGVLLGFVEAMDLVDEEDGAHAGGGGTFGFDHDLADLLNTGENGGELEEGGVGEGGDELGEGGFADAGRAPEDHGLRVVSLARSACLDGEAEGFAGAEEVLLADVLGEGAGAHALGKRGCCLRAWGRRGEG